MPFTPPASSVSKNDPSSAFNVPSSAKTLSFAACPANSFLPLRLKAKIPPRQIPQGPQGKRSSCASAMRSSLTSPRSKAVSCASN